MVQLKSIEKRWLTSAEASFNSCMVQLKYALGVKPETKSASFNSCMVQLK